jgi:O-antigen/teichoic acid export membrane protein
MQFLRKLLGGEIGRAGGLLTVATLLTGILGYAFQVLLARLLDRDSYAIFGAFNALGMILMSPLGMVVVLLVRQVAALTAHGALGQIPGLYRKSLGGLVAGGLMAGALAWVWLPGLQRYLRAPDPASIWIFWAATMLSAATILNGAFLQGFKKFAWLGSATTASVVFKVIAAPVLVTACGWGLHGALAAGAASGLITFVAGGVVLRAIMQPGVGSSIERCEEPRQTARSILPIAVGTIALAVMTQLDMLLVNHYFDPIAASQYAAASILGKVVLYLPGGVVTALLPVVAHAHARAGSSARALTDAIMMTVVMSGGAAAAYAVHGPWLIALLYGPRYADAGGLLAAYGFAMLPITVVMVVENFLMAKGRSLFAWLFIALCPLEVLTIHFWHPSPMAVVGVIGGFNLLLLVAGGVVAWLQMRAGRGQGTAANAAEKMVDQR